MPPGISPLIGYINKSAYWCFGVQLHFQLLLAFRKVIGCVTVAIQYYGCFFVLRRYNLKSTGWNVEGSRRNRTLFVEGGIVCDGLYSSFLCKCKGGGITGRLCCRRSSIGCIVNIRSFVAGGNCYLIFSVTADCRFGNQGRCMESLYVVYTKRTARIRKMDTYFFCFNSVEPYNTFVAYCCCRIYGLYRFPLSVDLCFYCEAAYTLSQRNIFLN